MSARRSTRSRATIKTGPAALSPTDRPLRALGRADLQRRFAAAIAGHDGLAGAHCIHEAWMRGEPGVNVDAWLAQLWEAAAATVPEWLPMRHVDWLPTVYDVCARFERSGRGRSNIYLVLLDFADSERGPCGIYVGSTRYSPAERFDQHKAGIRSAGSVLRRGLEVLIGPVLHLQGLRRAQAAEIEEGLAEALRAEGLVVRGGH